MKLIYLIITLTSLTACTKPAQETKMVGAGFEADKLFTVDGCTVYRFFDGGRNVYFTNCNGTTSYSESCGKNCTREVGVD